MIKGKPNPTSKHFILFLWPLYILQELATILYGAAEKGLLNAARIKQTLGVEKFGADYGMCYQ